MKKGNIKHITLHDVAKDAGVSVTTVSLVLRESTEVSKPTSKKVLESIRKLGYVYNRVAANLRSNQSTTVGTIINDISNPVSPEMIVGIQRELDIYGYTLLQGNTFYSLPNQRRLLETMLEQRVAGLIIAPVGGTVAQDLSIIQQNGIPIVLMARKVEGIKLDYVGGDFITGAKIAIQHLVQNGHRRIALLGGTNDNSAYLERLDGYMMGLKENGILPDPSIILNCIPTHEAAYCEVERLINLPQQPTAILCHNDVVAIGASMKLEELGLFPGKIALVGFDNIEAVYASRPSLTTISTSTVQWGKEAAQLLHKRILGSNDPPTQIILPPKLIIRQSSLISN